MLDAQTFDSHLEDAINEGDFAHALALIDESPYGQSKRTRLRERVKRIREEAGVA